jgi:rare lipoprotein A (peptidoglycan hydrolase)
MAIVIATPAAAQTTATSTPTLPSSLPLAGVSEQAADIRQNLDEATRRALDLEAQIADLTAERDALNERISVTATQIVMQRTEVRLAEAQLRDARDRYERRIIEVYKRGAIDTLSVLLGSESMSELLARAAVFNRIAQQDNRIMTDLTVATSNERYQAAQLGDLQDQDKTLKKEYESRLTALTSALSEQEALVERLTEESRTLLVQARSYNAQTRAQWKSSTIPLGTSIPRATATVSPYADRSYTVSAYMPRAYRTTGQSFSAVCSWYGPGFNGRTAASGQMFNEDDFTCASKTLPFGTLLALSRGERRIIVYVNDRGPYIAGRDLDLSRAAAAALGFGGVATVQAEIVVPAH